MSNKLEWHITWRDISDEDKSIHVKDKAPNAGVVKLVFCASKLRLDIGTALLCGKLWIQLPSTCLKMNNKLLRLSSPQLNGSHIEWKQHWMEAALWQYCQMSATSSWAAVGSERISSYLSRLGSTMNRESEDQTSDFVVNNHHIGSTFDVRSHFEVGVHNEFHYCWSSSLFISCNP